MDVTKVTSFHPGIVSGPLAEELYLNVIVAALQDPETGIPVTKKRVKDETLRVFTGTAMLTCLQQYGVEKGRGNDLASRLLEAGFIRSASEKISDFRESGTYSFMDVIVLDRRYIESKLSTALNYVTHVKPPSKRAEAPTLIGKLRRLMDPEADRSVQATQSPPVSLAQSPVSPPSIPLVASPRDKELKTEKSTRIQRPPASPTPPLEKSVAVLEKSLSSVTGWGVAMAASAAAPVDDVETLIEEDSDEIVFMIVPDDPVPLVKAATIDKLVERLTLEKFVDLRFQSKFLLTYRSFMEPVTLLSKLRDRYRSPNPSSPSSQALEPNELQRLRKVVMMRVVMVIARWIQDFWDDWRARDDMRSLLYAFLDMDVMPGPLAQLGAQLKANYQKQSAQTPSLFKSPTARFGYTPMSMIAAPADPFAPVFVFDEGRILDVAQQMTLRDFDRLTAIQYDEFLGKKWSKRGRDELSPGIVMMTNEFNALCEAVVQEIVSTLQLRNRVVVLQKYINLCLKLKEVHNFHSCMAVRAALLSAPVKRLSATWNELPQPMRTQFEDLERQFSYSSSFKVYRALLRGTEQPLIPYLGLYLTDLTFIEDGNPDTLGPLINFQKCSLIARVIEDIRMYQSIGFEPLGWKVNSAIQVWLANFKATIPSEQAYQLSLRIEPRNAQESLERMLMEEESLRERLREYEMRIATLEQENSRLKEQLTFLDNDLRVQIRSSVAFSIPTQPEAQAKKGGSALYTTLRKRRNRSLVDAAMAAPTVSFDLPHAPESEVRDRSSREAPEPPLSREGSLKTSGGASLKNSGGTQQQIDTALAEGLRLVGVQAATSSPTTSPPVPSVLSSTPVRFLPSPSPSSSPSALIFGTPSPALTSPLTSPPRSVSPGGVPQNTRPKPPPARPIPPLPVKEPSPRGAPVASPLNHRPTLGPAPATPPPQPPIDPVPIPPLSPKPMPKQAHTKSPARAIPTAHISPSKSPNGKR